MTYLPPGFLTGEGITTSHILTNSSSYVPSGISPIQRKRSYGTLWLKMTSLLTPILPMPRLQHRRGRRSDYLESLNNDYHKELRRRVFIRDGFRCRNERCGSKLFLELHHITYYINGRSIVGHELEDDNMKWTVTVCDNCHQIIHKDPQHTWNPKNKFKRHI